MSLSDAHRKMLLEDSGITEGVVEQRGYYTCEDSAHLKSLGFSDEQSACIPALVIPIWSVDREIVSYQIRPDNPRTKEGKPLKYESLPGVLPRIDVPPAIASQIDDPGHPLWITEGVKKADSACVRGMICVALVGVWLWRGSNSKGGSTELADWESVAIKGRVIYVAFDSDVMVKPEVRSALRRLALMLRRRGAKDVRPIVIPADDNQKVGLDDFFAAGGTARDLMECVDKDILATEGIVTNNRSLADVTDDALTAIVEANLPPSIFVRAGELTRIAIDERGIAKIEALSAPSLRGVLARCSGWIRVAKKEGATEISPPRDVVEDLMSLGRWPELPPIEAITRAPVLAPNGVLSMAPGYCPDSKFYVAAKDEWVDWKGSAESAVAYLLDEMLCDFPFAGDADRAHTLALMLLPILRPAIEGPTPLHLIDAPVQGTGKSLLAKVCLMPTAGNQISATAGTRDEEEWRKKIASSLLEGRAYIFFDNLDRKVDSASLAGVLTSTEWNDRALQTMRNINVPVRCAWVATANNAELSRDILRRTVWIRLDAKIERPEDRTAFKHENIELWVKENRAKIVSALCKLVSHWVDQGMPRHEGMQLGSFEEWSKAVGGILECVNVRGFLGNIKELRAAADTEEAEWSEFYRRWYVHFKNQAVKAGQLLEEFEISEELAGKLGDKGENSRKTRLGHLIRKRVGIVANGLRIMPAGERGGSGSYRLEGVYSPDGGVFRDGGGVFSENGGVYGGVSASQNYLDLDSNEEPVVGFGGVSTDPTHTRSRPGEHQTPRVHAPAPGPGHAHGNAATTPPNPTTGSKPHQKPHQDDEVIL